tara:strand:- start:318 stop:1019 length:702 start_codon:yes stop_codon:yes gene_type:complete
MRVAIHQPNYMPWLIYFRKLINSDIFVFFDNVQIPIGGKTFTSRTKVKVSNGETWLTVPVKKENTSKLIKDVRISDNDWVKKHINTIKFNYARSRWLYLFIENIIPIIEESNIYLADLNIKLIKKILDILSVNNTKLLRSSELNLINNNHLCIEEILINFKADFYLTGTGVGTLRHLDKNFFLNNNIKIKFVSQRYEKYYQMHGSFVNNLSIIDVILNCGPKKTLDLINNELT